MKQQDYETIVSCIQFGAPALATSLINGLNKTVENSNNWLQYQKQLAAGEPGKDSSKDSSKDLGKKPEK